VKILIFDFAVALFATEYKEPCLARLAKVMSNAKNDDYCGDAAANASASNKDLSDDSFGQVNK